MNETEQREGRTIKQEKGGTANRVRDVEQVRASFSWKRLSRGIARARN